MKILCNKNINSILLEDVQASENVSDHIKRAARDASKSGQIEWQLLKTIVLRIGLDGEKNYQLHQVCRGSNVVVPERPKSSSKPAELQSHLDKLARQLEDRKYAEMVRDVTAQEAAARDKVGLSSYKKQISFGVHIVATMGAFYAFGHVSASSFTDKKSLKPLFGLVLMILALLLETTLYIIRTTVPPSLHLAVEKRAKRDSVARKKDS